MCEAMRRQKISFSRCEQFLPHKYRKYLEVSHFRKLGHTEPSDLRLHIYINLCLPLFFGFVLKCLRTSREQFSGNDGMYGFRIGKLEEKEDKMLNDVTTENVLPNDKK